MHILIVGAGQGGLRLALSLLTHSIDVTLMTDRGPDEVRAGHILSTQAMFGPASQLERDHDHDLDLWSDQASRIDHLAMAVAGGEPTPVIKWSGHLSDPGAQSIDQRMKFARWMELFAGRGGHLVINGVSASEMDGLHELGRYDLTVIAAAKGELAELFVRDAARSPFSTPQRALSVVYTDGIVTLAEAGLPPDRAWMQRTFDRYWDHAEPVTAWTNLMLGPPPPHLLGLVAAAAHDNRIADHLAGAFSDPRDIDWILDPRHAEDFLERMGGASPVGA